MASDKPTQFPELNELLRELSERAAGILGGNFVGAYLQGSFAVGDADMQGDQQDPRDSHAATGRAAPAASGSSAAARRRWSGSC